MYICIYTERESIYGVYIYIYREREKLYISSAQPHCCLGAWALAARECEGTVFSRVFLRTRFWKIRYQHIMLCYCVCMFVLFVSCVCLLVSCVYLLLLCLFNKV